MEDNMERIVQTGKIAILVMLILMFGCAGHQKAVTIESGQSTIQLKASDFAFDPNVLKGRKGDVLTIVVENVSGTTHNLTVKSPQGNVLADVDISPKGTAKATVNLAEAGTYPFYCSKTMHSTFGMKGSIEVSP
jgi:plastocyanin